jgi:hypothetical protein
MSYKIINEGFFDAFKLGKTEVENATLQEKLKKLYEKYQETKDPEYREKLMQLGRKYFSGKSSELLQKGKLKGEELFGKSSEFSHKTGETLGKAYGHLQKAAEEHPYAAAAAATGALAAGAGALGLRKLLKRRQQNKQVNQ